MLLGTPPSDSRPRDENTKDAEDDHDECDPARYGWILPNVVVVCCILLTFSVVTPLVAPG